MKQVPEKKVSIMSRLYIFLEGRHTTAVLGFFITGNVFHYFHRLDATYIAFMTALMGFVIGHSVKEDLLPK